MLINGIPTTQISALDRGLCYGDGLFETLAIINGKPRLWPQHMERLKAGCLRLGLIMPDVTLIEQEILGLTATDTFATVPCVAKIILTRRQGGRGYRSSGSGECNRIISLFAWPDYPSSFDQGITVRWCHTRLGLNPALAGIKHLNRLEQVMGRSEWQDDSIAEGLMLDQQGQVIEGTMSNLFIVKGQQLLTSILDQCGIQGIIRQLIYNDRIGHGLAVTEQHLEQKDVLEADEVFICNSLIGLWPVVHLHDKQTPKHYDVGDVSQHIRTALQSYWQT